MWLKVAFFCLYLLALFFISLFLEASQWLEGGLFSTMMIHPLSMSVKQLKRILDSRGVSYVGAIQKEELSTLVESSGPLMESELDEAMNTEDVIAIEAQESIPSTEFICGSHFYEEVEDSKDSIWLVQVIPIKTKLQLVNDYHWRRIVARLKPFGIRSGVFNCHLDKRLCDSKGWDEPQVLLALPKGTHPKDNVILHSFKRGSTADSVISWVRRHLTSRLKVVSSKADLDRKWLNFTKSVSETKIRVLLATSAKEPPLSFSALSMKYAGRVTFGIATPKILGHSSIPSDCKNLTACYIVFTPEGISVYGKRVGEYLSYQRMAFYLQTLQPEMNDMFLTSLVFTNLIALLDLFVLRRSLWRQLIASFWVLLKYNGVLLLFWISLCGLYNFTFMQQISDTCVRLVRSMARSELFGLARHHYRFWRSSVKALLASYGILLVVYVYFRRRWFANDAGNADERLLLMFSTLLFRPRNFRNNNVEEDLELLIERLATPNLWLHPLIPCDYICELPIWKYHGDVRSMEQTDNVTPSCSKIEQSLSEEDEQSSEDAIPEESCCPTPICQEQQEGAISDSNRSCLTEPSASWQKELVECISTKLNLLYRFARRSYRIVARSFRRARCGAKHRSGPPPGTKETTKCAICLDDYQHGVILCGLPCGHNYHQRCIVDWLSRDHHSCPICRQSSYGLRGAKHHYD